METMAMVLEGLRGLDWSVFQQGPVASMLLGDLGADVIKIEERTGGDLDRGIRRLTGVPINGEEVKRNPYIEAGNRNMRGLTVDMKEEEKP